MSEVLGRPRWCSTCEDRRIFSPDHYGAWRCLVCENRDPSFARSGSPDGPVPVSSITGAGPSPTKRCKACALGLTRWHSCIDKIAARDTAACGGGASASTQPAVRPPERTADGPHRFFDGGDAA